MIPMAHLATRASRAPQTLNDSGVRVCVAARSAIRDGCAATNASPSRAEAPEEAGAALATMRP